MTSGSPSSDDAIDRLRESWSSEAPVTAEELLTLNPALASNASAAVDLIYAEILLREQHGESPTETEYCDRFPQFREQILRQFQLHRVLKEMDADVPAPTFKPEDTLSDLRDATSAISTLRIPGFEVCEVVGRGGSGIAYRAIDTKLKRTVAIKLLQAAGAEHHQHLLREAESAASLVHPNIVQVHQIGEDRGTPFLVMEFIDGESLSKKLQEGPLQPSEAVDLLIQVASAIQFAHDNNIVHRDLKPGNVLIDQSGVSHVCDFGLARRLDSEFTLHATGDVVGTPAYMAPEQARGETVTAAADVYALGTILYHCLTGRPPFQAATPWEILNQVMADEPVSVSHLNAAVPQDLDTICAAAMHKAPTRRIGSAAEFAAELTRYKSGQPIQSRPVGRAERAWKLCRRNPAVAGLIGVSVLALSVITIVSVLSQREVSSALSQTEKALTEAKTQRDVAFDAMQNLVHEVHDDLERHEASVEARGQVLSSAIEGLQKIIDTGDADPEILRTMAEARTQYGFILAQQGQNDASISEYRQAVAIAENIDGDEGRMDHALNLALLASQYMRVADLDTAVDVCRRAVEEFEILTAEMPDNVPLHLNAAAARKTLADCLIALEDRPEGLTQLEIAQRAVRDVIARSRDDSTAERTLIEIDMSLANLCFAIGETDKAESALQEAIGFIEADPVGIESDTQLHRDYLTCSQLSGLSKLSRMQYVEAIEAFTITREGFERLIKREPTRPGFPLKLGVVSGYLTTCHLALNELDTAEKHIRVAIEQYTRGMELGGPEYRVQRSAIAASLGQLTDLQMRRGKLKEAAVTMAKVGEAIEPLIEEYQLQGMQAEVLFRVEVLKGLAGQDCSVDPGELKLARRSFQAWSQLHEGDTKEFEEMESQLVADISASNHPVIKSSLVMTLALSRGQYFELLSARKDASPEQLRMAEARAMQSIQSAIAAPGTNPTFYLGIPEFAALRRTESFQTAFAPK